MVIPEIADYEVRRELLRAEKSLGLARLNALKGMLSYPPITTPTMIQAAEFWAAARRLGRKMADHSALDADVILAAQAVVMAGEGSPTVVATTNVRHWELFTAAKEWRSVN